MPRHKSKKRKTSPAVQQEQYIHDPSDNYTQIKKQLASPRRGNKKKKRKKKHIPKPLEPLGSNICFLDQLYPLGLSIRTVTNDGNSLFRAISDQLHGHENDHHQFRKETIEYMTLHSDEFSPFYVGDFNEYLTKMSRDGIHGGNMELTASAKRYKIDIFIHNLNVDPYVMLYPLGQSQRSIHLSFHNDRDYASVRKLNDMKSLQPAKIIHLDRMNENEKAVIDDMDGAMNGIVINDDIVCVCGHRNKSDWMFCSNCGWCLSYVPLNDDDGENEGKQCENIQNNEESHLNKPFGIEDVIQWKKNNLCHCGSGNKYRKCCSKYGSNMGRKMFEKQKKKREIIQDIVKRTKMSLNVKCYCGSGKKYKKCCKVNSKGSGYDDRRLDEIHVMDESNVLINRLEDALAHFSGSKQHKVLMMKELDELRSQQNMLLNKMKCTKISESKNEELFEGKLVKDNNVYMETLNELEKMKQEIADLKMENERLQQQKDKECVVCMDGSRNYACVPCGHLCLCDKCMALINETCPVCQHEYESLIKIYS